MLKKSNWSPAARILLREKAPSKEHGPDENAQQTCQPLLGPLHIPSYNYSTVSETKVLKVLSVGYIYYKKNRFL